MTSPGTVAFDIIGTSFSLSKPRQRLVDLGAPAYALQLWFAQTLRDAFALSHAGDYQPLKNVLEAELPRTLAMLGVASSSEQRAQVVSAFSELDLETGALEGFQQLTEGGWKLTALTNGSIESTHQLLEKAGALQYFTQVRSCDEVRRTKPHPEVYQLLQPSEGDTWMVAAHAWDIVGAARAGLKTAFVEAEEKSYLSVYAEPNFTAPNLETAIAQIIHSASD